MCGTVFLPELTPPKRGAVLKSLGPSFEVRLGGSERLRERAHSTQAQRVPAAHLLWQGASSASRVNSSRDDLAESILDHAIQQAFAEPCRPDEKRKRLSLCTPGAMGTFRDISI